MIYIVIPIEKKAMDDNIVNLLSELEIGIASIQNLIEWAIEM